MTLRVGLLGMPDNLSTRVVLGELTRLGRRPDVVFLLKSDAKTSWRRLVRKLKGAGLRATVDRVAFALRNRVRAGGGSSGTQMPLPDTVHWVTDFNGAHCRQLIRDSDLDVLLSSIDTMIGRGTFSIPRLGTLNAHPGWVPSYRGLGSNIRMMEDGLLPAISVHWIDEGVDTGPVLLRRTLDPQYGHGNSSGDTAQYLDQARLFAEALALLEEGHVQPIDTFLEPSNMTRGIPASRARQASTRLRVGIRSLERAESRPSLKAAGPASVEDQGPAV